MSIPCLLVPLSSHAAASACRILSKSSSPALPAGLTLQRRRTSRRCLVVSHCAADPTCQPSPEEDPGAARYRKFREEMDKCKRDIGAAFRDVEGCSSQDAMVAELNMTLFRDEDDKLQTYAREIASDRCILYKEGRRLALMVCKRAGMAIHMSALVAAYARLRVDESRGVSFLTVEQMVRTYVSTFLKIVEDSCHRKVDRTSIISFLRALRGLAAISHILIQDDLDALNNIEGCSETFSTVYDVDALNHKMHCNMKELEMKLTAASDGEAYKLLWSTLNDAADHASLFVIRTTYLRKRVLKHIQNHVQVGQTIGKECANDNEHTNGKERTNGEEHDAS